MQKTVDRRIRKTKLQLRAGLMKLMQEKNIKDITVKELVEEVDINRSTFYLHYTDIYDMLDKLEAEFFDSFLEVLRESGQTVLNPPNPEILLNNWEKSEHLPFLTSLFQIVHENRDLCLVLMGPHGDITFMNKVIHLMTDYITANVERNGFVFDSMPEDKGCRYTCEYALYGCLGVLRKWLENNDETAETMAKITKSLIVNNLHLKKA